MALVVKADTAFGITLRTSNDDMHTKSGGRSWDRNKSIVVYLIGAGVKQSHVILAERSGDVNIISIGPFEPLSNVPAQHQVVL